MGIKRKIEENIDEPEKKNKLDQIFPIEIFIKNLKDPESSFLALSEFNEHVRHLSSQEEIDQLMENFLQYLKSNLNDVLALITEEKRKSSENITLYRFLTTLLEYFSRKNDLILSETIIKKFVSISNSIYTIYFMLSSHSTASHLKITLRFLISMIQQNEFSARLIFSLIDFKRLCWKPLFKRRDIRDSEDVRYWVIKFFLSPLIYQHIDTIRNLIKEPNIFHEIFNGLVNDSRHTIEFILGEIRTNIIMVPGVTKTDKIHLFDDRNLKSLIRLYNWTGQQKQKDIIKTKKKNKFDESLDFDEMEVKESSDRNEVRRINHTFMMIILNSKNYGINFFDTNFGTSTKNSNPIIFKVISSLSNYFLTDEYAANLIVTCLTTCPDLLQSFFKLISHEYVSIRSKNLSGTLEFLCEIIQQQKSLNTWHEIFQTITDSIKLTDILIYLTLPIDIMNKFDQVILKNSDTTIQLVSMKFLSMVLEKIQEAFNMIMNLPLACEKISVVEAYQQAILRYIPKPDHFCDSLNLLKTVKSTSDYNQSISQYISLLKLYSSSCFMSMSAMNINLDILLSNSILNLLVFFKDLSLEKDIIENYFQCIKNILNYRESIDDVTWARHNKELECTPIRMLFKLGKQLKNFNKTAEDLSLIISKFSSILNNHDQEIIIWIYIWLKLGINEKIEQFLSNIIEKIILNPYPLVEKTIKQSGYSLMIYSALDTVQHTKEDISNEIDEYLCHVIFQIYIEQINQPLDKVHQYLRKIYLKDKKHMKIYQLLNVISSPDKQNQVLMDEINNIEKLILENIDLEKGPDNMQINLAMKLNIFKIFALHENDNSRLITEMIQCLNIVLLLHDSHRSFEVLFDRTIEYIESYSSSIENRQIISLICQLINGLDMSHQTSKSLQHSKILLKCLECEPNNYRLIYFTSNYLSSEYRTEFLNIICQTFTNNIDILKIIINEIKINKEVNNEQFLDTIIDGLKELNDNIEQGIECIMELIDRMEKISNKNWKNILRLKQKILFKLAYKDYSQSQTRIIVAKLIVRTITALRSDDRIYAIKRLINKSDHSILLLAYVFHDLLNLDESIENEIFIDYLQKLIDNYSSESITFDLLHIYCQKNLNQHEKILKLLQNDDNQQGLPIKQTNQLLLILKLFPESILIAETTYRTLVKKAVLFFESSNENNQNIDEWLISFEQCANRLLTETTYQIDLYDLINHLLKYFTTFTTNSINLLKTLIEFFVSRQSFDQKHLSKLFANFLKHKNFLEQLSSFNRSLLVDILSLFVSHYDFNQSSITIDCSKHFPMLLSIYNPTLSNNDQHTLACMYTYEKYGCSMKSAFIWGEAALKLYSTTIDTKNILLQTSKLEQIMNLLDDKMMIKSILFYPVKRRLRTIEPQIYEEGDQIYDPVYLIPVFYHSLGPECVVKCQQFVEKHCLAYCLMALGSRCGLLRAVVYNCLARFEQHLISQRFYCKEQILTMLTLLKQSIKKPNLKLAPIVSLFLSKLVDLFTHPESKLYRTITRFLLKQPYIDLVHIPLFSDLFHSSTIEYKYERGWILNLLKHGIKDSIDYTLCTKAYVFKTLMTFYDCSLCDDSTKLEILNVFYSTSKLQDVLMSLLFDYGFLLWLQVIVKNCSSESLMILSLIIQNIGLRLVSIDNQVQLLEFDCLLILFIRRLKNETTITSSTADNVISTLIKYQGRLKSSKNSLDIKQIKHIVDFSTIMKNTSLLSCFC
ncbi:unnamed protein product [Rotaria sordida]|uniref:Nucleolar pre-ribosomal-associated protein 1 C-terminal domain-containing protein n=1 Tax=Rotaria sordida TaxID=392033 RepID=A0A818ZH74_9BILA|nr:unnamed protein product [Rotaria sordida]CAF3763601.1 unnamed protein product [Rotaria sordida]